MDFNQLESLCGAGSSSRYSAVIICHAVATAMAVVAVAVTAAADAAVKLLLKVTPKRRDMKELWLAAATFGSLAPLPLCSLRVNFVCRLLTAHSFHVGKNFVKVSEC